jgi:hypothetical protein
MDRDHVLGDLDRIVEPGGAILIAREDEDIWTSKVAWKVRAREVVQTVLGPRRMAGTSYYEEPSEGHEEVLRRSAFSSIETGRCDLLGLYRADDILGYLYSTSFCSPRILGSRMGLFEERLRAALWELDRDGTFLDELRIRFIIATRPDPARPRPDRCNPG